MISFGSFLQIVNFKTNDFKLVFFHLFPFQLFLLCELYSFSDCKCLIFDMSSVFVAFMEHLIRRGVALQYESIGNFTLPENYKWLQTTKIEDNSVKRCSFINLNTGLVTVFLSCTGGMRPRILITSLMHGQYLLNRHYLVFNF